MVYYESHLKVDTTQALTIIKEVVSCVHNIMALFCGSSTGSYIRYISVAVTNQHDQGSLRKKVYFGLQFQRIKVHHGMEASKQLTVVAARGGS